MLFDFVIFLAQSSSDGSSNFQGELARLIAVLCVLTALWLSVMYMLYRRTIERRRREREGLPPLPGAWVSLQQWLSGTHRPADPPESSSALMPDLDMLTADLPRPDLAAMMGDFESPAPVDLASEFELPPTPVYDDQPVDDDEQRAATFALDHPQDEESIPVQPGDMEDTMPAPPDSIELLRVWRDLSDGSLIIEIGGQRFTSVSELQGANLDRRFMNVVRDLTAMLRAAPEQPPAPPKAQPKSAAVPPARPAQTPKSTAEAPPAEAKPDQPAKKPAPPANGELPSMAPGTMFKQMGRVAMGHKPEPVEEKPVLSIPDQIEQVLQKHLADLPEYTGRSIHVRPSPFGGVRIEVDGQFFEGVGDVTDDTVRALIQNAVREWEQGQ
jgi:hypothetical protein